MVGFLDSGFWQREIGGFPGSWSSGNVMEGRNDSRSEKKDLFM